MHCERSYVHPSSCRQPTCVKVGLTHRGSTIYLGPDHMNLILFLQPIEFWPRDTKRHRPGGRILFCVQGSTGTGCTVEWKVARRAIELGSISKWAFIGIVAFCI